jgi:hypothetical protein
MNWRLACLLSAALALAAASRASAADDAGPTPIGAVSLRLPDQELVRFQGLANNDHAGGSPAGILYFGGPIGLVAGIITQGAIEKHQQDKLKQTMHDIADQVLTPYQATLHRFTNKAFAERAYEVFSTEEAKTLLRALDPQATGLKIDCSPGFFMTTDARTVIIENPILIYTTSATAKTPPIFKNVVRIVAIPRPPHGESAEDSWAANDGAELETLAVGELRESLRLALIEATQGYANHSAEYRNVHYLEGTREKVEHSLVLMELADHMILKTLRGWILSVPVMPAVSQSALTAKTGDGSP